jgi:PEP-CTERM motif
MKTIYFATVVATFFAIGAARSVLGQGTTTFVSNLGQTPDGANPVGSDSWLAASLFTGVNGGGYSLNSVQLGLADATGSPSGFSVMIYTSGDVAGAIRPTGSIGTLTGSINPSSGGTYTFTAASGIFLSPSTEYFIVISAGTTVANGAFAWNFEDASDYQPSGGWLGGVTFGSGNGSTLSWMPLGSSPSYENSQFAITATPAPEPGTLGLLALGGMVVGLYKARGADKFKIKSAKLKV